MYAQTISYAWNNVENREASNLSEVNNCDDGEEERSSYQKTFII